MDDIEPKIPQIEYSKNISLDNFDPLDRRKLLTSPRSIQVCKLNNIPIANLFHSSYEDIKGTTLQKNNSKYLKSKYINTETKRLKLVEYLKSLRRELMRQSEDMIFENRRIGSRYKKEYEESRRSLEKKTKNEMIKEIWFMVKRANKNSVASCYREEKERRLCSLSRSYLVDMKKTYNKYYKAKINMYKKRILFNAKHYQQHREIYETIRAESEHKRNQLIQKINERSYKIDYFKDKQRQLAKYKQMLRKNVAIQKYNIRKQLEK